MPFNPFNDQLSFKLKSFTPTKSTDALQREAEVYFLPFFADATLNTDGTVESWFSFPSDSIATFDVKKNETKTFTNPPALYGLKTPGPQLDYSILFYDSDEKGRNIARAVQDILTSSAVEAALNRYGAAADRLLVQAAQVAAAMSGDPVAAAAVSEKFTESDLIGSRLNLMRTVAGAIAGAFANTKDDLMARMDGTLDASNNFRANEPPFQETGSKLNARFFVTTVAGPPPTAPTEPREPVFEIGTIRTISINRARKLGKLTSFLRG